MGTRMSVMTTRHPTTAAEVGQGLRGLYAERALAETHGLADNRLYMVDLEDDIRRSRLLYVGMAVTEIATLRAELSGPLRG